MQPAIRLEGLTKYYGKQRGVEDLDLEVAAGEVFGYLGPNGAGKTTTIRVMLDLLRPTSGRAEVLGMDSKRDSVAIRRRIGYLPGELTLYEKMTGADLLEYFAHLRDIGDQSRGIGLAERFDLDLSRPLGELSRGNKQKVGLVQALMHEPDLLILDEPTSGLDPLIQQEFHAMVSEIRGRGGTVFLSSHVLDEVERIADRVGIIREGRLVVTEDVDALKGKALRKLEIRFGEPVPVDRFTALPGVQEAALDGEVLRCTMNGPVDALIKAAAEFEVISIKSEEADLEEVFLQYYYGKDEGAP